MLSDLFFHCICKQETKTKDDRMNMKTMSYSVLATLIAAASAQAMAAPAEIKVWRHDTNEKEIAASKAAVERFNKSQNDYKVVMEMILINIQQKSKHY